MDNANGNLPTPPAGQPVNYSAGADAQPDMVDGETPQSITREEVLQLINDGIKRQAQSTRDIVASRVNQELERRIEQLQAAGISVTQQQAAALQKQIADETRMQSGGDYSQAQAAQPEAVNQNSQPNDPVTVEAYKIMEKYGVQLMDDDPEIQNIRQDSIYGFLRSVEEAAQAKQARTAKHPAAHTPTMPGGPGKPGNPIADVKDIDTLYEMANKRR